MNRTLQYLKNIRFNPIINKTAAQQSKQKYTVNESKKTPSTDNCEKIYNIF